MKTIILSVLTFSAITLFSFVITGQKGQTSYKVDPASSTLKWTGKKVTGEHYGNVKLSKGNLVIENNQVKSGTFDIDLTSITVTDIQDRETNQKLVNHLKADDFFSTAKHPNATFTITKVELKNKDQYNVTGNLTIKGITNTVEFPAIIKVDPSKVTAVGTISIDRTKYDIKFKSASFFENLGDKAIADIFTLDVNLVASR